jgi:hypothetical protein
MLSIPVSLCRGAFGKKMQSDWVIPTPSDGWAGIQPEPRYYSKEGMAGQGISAAALLGYAFVLS